MTTVEWVECNNCGAIGAHDYPGLNAEGSAEGIGVVAWNTRTPARGGDELREAAQAMLTKRWASSGGEWGVPEWVETDEPRRFAEQVLASTDMAGAGEKTREALIATKAMYEVEIALLRNTLIAMGRMIPGVALHDDVSSSFLALLPTELASVLAAPPVEGLTSGEGGRYADGYTQGLADADRQHQWMQDKAWQDAVLMLVHYQTLAERTWLVGHEEAAAKLAEWWKRAKALAETKSVEDITASPKATATASVRDAEVDRLMHVIDRDRYVVAHCLNEIKRQISGREWLTGGRGPYEWDDDRYQAEFADAIEAIQEAMKPLAIVAWDKSDCTRIEERVNAARLAARDLLAKPIGRRAMIEADIFGDPRDILIERLHSQIAFLTDSGTAATIGGERA